MTTQTLQTTMTTVTMTGHLIDSLVLTKVLDLILTHGGEYRVNDITVGIQKHELSHASVNVYADTPEKLNAILEVLAPHGVKPVGSQPTALKTVAAAGILPDGSLVLHPLPHQVKTHKGWVQIDPQGVESLVVVVSDDEANATIKSVSKLQPGDRVVADYHSLQWED